MVDCSCEFERHIDGRCFSGIPVGLRLIIDGLRLDEVSAGESVSVREVQDVAPFPDPLCDESDTVEILALNLERVLEARHSALSLWNLVVCHKDVHQGQLAVVLELVEENDFIEPGRIEHLSFLEDVIILSAVDVNVSVKLLNGIDHIGCERLHVVLRHDSRLGLVRDGVRAVCRAGHGSHCPSDDGRDCVRVRCGVLSNRPPVVECLQHAENSAVLRIIDSPFICRECKDGIRRAALDVLRDFQNLHIGHGLAVNPCIPFPIRSPACLNRLQRGFRTVVAGGCRAVRNGECPCGDHGSWGVSASGSFLRYGDDSVIHSDCINRIDCYFPSERSRYVDSRCLHGGSDSKIRARRDCCAVKSDRVACSCIRR